MLANNQESVTNSFLGFASQASNILHIKTEQDYQDALETIEHLFSEATDAIDDPLNDLIDLIVKSIEVYESENEDIVQFGSAAKQIPQDIAVLRVLMDQHGLSISDFKNELGSKPLVSMILNGKRNLTKDHIAKLCERFSLSPSLFFDLKIA